MIEDLLPIGLLIVVAKFLKRLLDRIGLSSSVAYAAAGTLLALVAGVFEPTSILQVFPGIGVFILFFLVGLDEIDIPGFAATIRGRFFCATFQGAVAVIVSPARLTSVPSISIFRDRYSRPTTDPHPAVLLNGAAS